MTISRQQLLKLKQRQQEFIHLTDMCTRDELIKCARLLAMYLALYRQEFGDITPEGYRKILRTDSPDDEMLMISMEGMHEAAEMLKMVLMQDREKTDSDPENIHLN